MRIPSAVTALLDHQCAQPLSNTRMRALALVVLTTLTLGGCQEREDHSAKAPQAAPAPPAAPPRYPSEPFKGYSADDEAQVLERCRTSSREGFESFTEHEAAYKALVVDAHFLYFAFAKLFPTSEHVPELTEQMERFHLYQVTGPADASGFVQIPIPDLLGDFHWNWYGLRSVLTTKAYGMINGVPVNGHFAWGNVQYVGMMKREGDHASVVPGTVLIFPARDMSPESKRYRNAVGIRAGYLPDGQSTEKPEELFAKGVRSFDRGTTRDQIDAVKLWTRAAELGSSRAQMNLAAAMLSGDGLGADFPEAVKWLVLSAEAGVAMAKQNLARLRPGDIDDDEYSEGVRRAAAWKQRTGRNPSAGTTQAPAATSTAPTK